jgi:hypothetical protein
MTHHRRVDNEKWYWVWMVRIIKTADCGTRYGCRRIGECSQIWGSVGRTIFNELFAQLRAFSQ